MCIESATMNRQQLEDALSKATRHPHSDIAKGEVIISPRAFSSPHRETNLVISPFSILDCTGSIFIGPWCNIGPRCRIYTHDHFHQGRKPLALINEEYGVAWQDKYIGEDVWIHDGSLILYQVTKIPKGVIIGAGSVLTKNPDAYEIWAGNPARKIKDRKKGDHPGNGKSPFDHQFLLKDNPNLIQ